MGDVRSYSITLSEPTKKPHPKIGLFLAVLDGFERPAQSLFQRVEVSAIVGAVLQLNVEVAVFLVNLRFDN